ncbi:MAG: DNA repair protein RecO [Propionibacteriaceae bacterium]|jgi:DNA repair protein RecO (recombination protein O)|nr:DNA repair protein RecO [Propionibacteriaceae bacterium]
MPTYRDEAVVLRTHKLGEADRIVTMLSRRHGKIRAVAKGVRRTSSKFGARLEPFSQVDLQIASGRSLDTITQAMTMHAPFNPIGADYAFYTAGQVMVETADRLLPIEGEPALQQYLLLAGALKAMVNGTTDGKRPPSMIMDSYLLRAVATAGYAPVLDKCARCGTLGSHDRFSVSAGGVVCAACREVGAVRVSAAVLSHLTALLTGDWPATRAVTAATAQAASGVIAAFASWHIERTIRSLEMVDRSGSGFVEKFPLDGTSGQRSSQTGDPR